MRSAAALIAANRPQPLAEQRTRLGLTQAQVARRMGVRQERVSAIERAEPGATEVRTLASYVEALGSQARTLSPTSAATASCSADQGDLPGEAQDLGGGAAAAVAVPDFFTRPGAVGPGILTAVVDGDDHGGAPGLAYW